MIIPDGGQGGKVAVSSAQAFGDRTLLEAIISMAERETLTVNKGYSDVLGTLAPVQWLLQRSRGAPLTIEQAIELDDMLHGFCSHDQALDLMLSRVIGFLEATNVQVREMIVDWKDAEQGQTESFKACHEIASGEPSATGMAA